MFTYSPPYQTLKSHAPNSVHFYPSPHKESCSLKFYVNHIPLLLFLDWTHMSICIHICICVYTIYIFTYEVIYI